jgi:hypothetical protein
MPENIKVLHKHLFSTFNDVTTGIRRAPWYFSNNFILPLKLDVFSHLAYFNPKTSLPGFKDGLVSSMLQIDRDFKAKESYLANPSPTGGFYNFFNSLSLTNSFLNLR